jgi:hypothetical protein
MWKKAAVAKYKMLPGICLEGLKKAAKYLSHPMLGPAFHASDYETRC